LITETDQIKESLKTYDQLTNNS